MIKARNLGMRFTQDGEELCVLKGINFTVEQGETVAIVGPSGSGKSTLLQLLAALEAPTEGQIELDRQNLASLSSDALADFRRDNMGIVFQAFHLIDSLSALANVSLPLDIRGVPNAAEQARAMLKRVGLEDREKHYPRQLSGGEQQRVAIARAVVHQPKLLLADEPTGNLDQRTGTRIADLLFSLHAETDATLVLVTHDMKLAKRCERVFWLESGHLEVDHNGL